MQIRSAPRVPRVRRLPRACTGQARGPPRRTQLCPCPAPRPPRGQRGRGLPPRRGRVPSRSRSALVPLRAAKEANARERRAPSPVCVAGLPGAPPQDGAAPTPLTRPRPDARPSPGGARRLQQGTTGVHGASSSCAGVPPTHKSHGGGVGAAGCPQPTGCSPAAHELLSAVGHVAGALAHGKPRGGRALRPGPSGATAEGPRPPHPGWAGTPAVLELVPTQDGCRGREPPAAGLPIAVAPCVDRGPLGAPPAVQDPRPLVPPPSPGPAFSEPLSRCGGAPCARWRGRPRLVRAAPAAARSDFMLGVPARLHDVVLDQSGQLRRIKGKKKKKLKEKKAPAAL